MPTIMVCTPNAARCAGKTVKVCSADGATETTEETCTARQTCTDGVCTDTDQTCAPNTKFCQDGAVWKCDAEGATVMSQQCKLDQFCREDGDSASCTNQACTPGESLCDGQTATTCLADGSGTKPGGTDCSASKQTCYQGQCRDVACTGGMKVCQHDDVYLCSLNGTGMSLLADCQGNEVCDGGMGACRARVCEPGKVSCDGTRVVTCNEYGSAWLTDSKDCAAESKICAAGSCKKQVCLSNSTYCQDNKIYQCDSTGTTGTLSQTCGEQYHCVSWTTYAVCQQKECTPGQILCDANVVKTCTADGDYPTDGAPCGNDEYCDAAKCKPRGCQIDQAFCQSGSIYYCNQFGPPSLVQQCGADTVCKATDQGASCTELPCSPGTTTCLGNKVGTCAADGQALSKVTDDCIATSTVCTADLKCAKSTIDLLALNENLEAFSGGTFIGDAVEMSSARKLTELQVNLVINGMRELRWAIFELNANNIYVAKVDKIVSNVTGNGYISSGPLNFTLKAGKRYLLGVAVSGGDSVAVAYYDTAPFSSPISFGTVIGRVNNYYTSQLDSGNVYPEYAYQVKVTTEAP